jgi:phosphoglycolate phosphatase
MPPPRPRAVLFDWDNTLVDGWASVAAALNVVFRGRGMPEWTAREAQARVRGSARETFPAMFGAGWERDLTVFYAAIGDVHLRQLRELPGARALLAACAFVPLAVVSNKSGPVLRREVAHLGWTSCFGAVVGAGDAAADKPDPAPIRMALGLLGVEAGSDVWYVGDTALDMEAARAAGCRAVLLGDAAHDGGLDHARPDAHYACADQLGGEIAALA